MNSTPGFTSTGFRSSFLTLGILVLLGSSNAWSIPISFDLRDTSATSEIESGVITRGGVTATLTSLVAGGIGSLNQTLSGFGVDATGSGDDTDALDDGLGLESIAFQFDQDVLFSGLALSLLTSSQSDEGSLMIGPVTIVSLTDTGAGNDIFSFASDNLVTVGQSVLLRFVGGNGFSVDSFSVDPVPPSATTSVPDSLPSCFAAAVLLTLVLLGGTATPRGVAETMG